MKPEQSEQFLIEELFGQSQDKGMCRSEKLVNIDKLAGDASTRRYYRLYTNLKSYVVCLDNPHVIENGPHPFVSKQVYLKSKNIRVPEVLDTNLTKGYILEEDLGDKTFLQLLTTLESDEEEYKVYERLIDQLLAIHKIPSQEVDSSKLFSLRFDYAKYMEEIDFTIKFFVKNFLKCQDENQVQQLRTGFHGLCERLSSQAMVLTHRDFHSRNVMVKDDELVFIDFQDARWGIPQYDLVSLLEDCYYQLSSSNRRKLIQHYFNGLETKIHQQGAYANFMGFYYDMAIQRVFKAIGSFSYIYATRQDVRYLKYIGFGMEKLRRIMMNDPKYLEMKKILFTIYYAQ